MAIRLFTLEIKVIFLVYEIINNTYPNLLSFYKSLRKDQSYWELLEKDIENYCTNNSLKCKIAFHHGGFTKSKKKSINRIK